jgi:hypothetical protein
MASRALLLSQSLLALSFLALTAAAQETPSSDLPVGRPIQLGAPEFDPSGAGPAGLGPADLGPPEPLPSEIASMQPSGIEAEELTQLDGWSVSALSRSQGALPANLWAGTDGTQLAALLQRLPANYGSPAAQALATRVLLSGGDAPSGNTLEAMRKRFEALGRAGLADPLSILAAGAAGSTSDPTVAQFAAQAELARGRRADACARGRAASSDEPSTFLLRLRAYCAAATGDRAAADLALELTNNVSDQAWYRAAAAAVGGAPAARTTAARYDSSLNAALSIAANLRPGPNPLANASNLAVLTVARAEAAPQPVRTQAAALAVRRGFLSPAEARPIMRAAPATATNLPAIATALRAVEAAPGSLAAATAIAGVLRQSTAPADFTAVARFFKDDIANLQAAPNAGAALDFARAALAAGDVELATRLATAANQAGVAPAARAPYEAALALARRENAGALALAAKRRIETAPAPGRAGATRDAMILAAMGASLDAQAQAFVAASPAQTGAAADPALLASLNAAAQRHAIGETGLLAVAASGEGPARLNAQSLVQILTALRQSGLEDHARAFAIEALLAGAPAAAPPAR